MNSNHPRPNFERTHWISLNGQWEFEFDDQQIGEQQQWFGKELSRQIVVPFCYQSQASGIHDRTYHPHMWYRKKITLAAEDLNGKILLHFGAVDYQCKVWINGSCAGTHRGGHVSFCFDIAPYCKKGDNWIAVQVTDLADCTQPRGKQNWQQEPFGCWYTPTSGIWQNVWIEFVGKAYVERCLITPDLDTHRAYFDIRLDSVPVKPLQLEVSVSFNEKPVSTVQIVVTGQRQRLDICVNPENSVDDIHTWSPDHPNLYWVRLVLKDGDEELDDVRTYFGMRKISVQNGKILLNNRPLYQKLILDQGYWPDTLLTPPSEEALRKDLELVKAFGFNGVRKHQKFEDPRFHWLADTMGLLVWGELPSAYEFSVDEMRNVIDELHDGILRDFNHPCIITWVPLNESWGVRDIFISESQQHFAKALYQYIKALDPSRLISGNDGWEQVESDICAVHDYAADGEDLSHKWNDIPNLLKGAAGSRSIYAQGYRYDGEPIIVTEFGGFAFAQESVDGHWGYNHGVENEDAFVARFASLVTAIEGNPDIQGFCFTQLTDVEQEVNGLMSPDRKPKVSVEKIRNILL